MRVCVCVAALGRAGAVNGDSRATSRSRGARTGDGRTFVPCRWPRVGTSRRPCSWAEWGRRWRGGDATEVGGVVEEEEEEEEEEGEGEEGETETAADADADADVAPAGDGVRDIEVPGELRGVVGAREVGGEGGAASRLRRWLLPRSSSP